MTLITSRNVPPRDDDDIRAWDLVIDAIEEAMDLDVCPHDRGILAQMHEDASWLACRGPRVTPEDVIGEATTGCYFDTADWERRRAIEHGPGGIAELRPYLTGRALPAYNLMTGPDEPRLLTVEQVRAWIGEHYERVQAGKASSPRGIGPVRCKAILAALDAHAAETVEATS